MTATIIGTSGPFTSVTGQTLPVPWPAGHVAEHRAYLFTQSANEGLVLSPSAGFAQHPSAGTGTATVVPVGFAVANEANPTTGFTVTVPAPVITGDDLYVSVMSTGHTSSSIALPTVVDNDGGTWELIKQSSGGSATLWRRRATSATANKTITVAGCLNSAAGGVGAYRGSDGPTNVILTANQAGDTSAPAILPDEDGSMICLALYNKAGAFTTSAPACSNPGPLSARFEKLSTGGTDCAVMHASALQPGDAAPTGNFTWTPSGVGTEATLSIAWALKPQVGGVRLILHTCLATGPAMPSPVILSPLDHVYAFMVTVAGGDLVAPFDVPITRSFIEIDPVAPIEFPAGSTLGPDRLLLMAVAHSIDSSGAKVSLWTNNPLGTPAEVHDGSTALGQGGGIAIATLVKPTAGSFSATVAALATASRQAGMLLVLTPASVVPEIPDTAFLVLQDPAEPAFKRVLNVAAFRELAPEYQGKKERAFARNFISTRRGRKRAWQASVEFRLPTDVDDFLAFIDGRPFPTLPLAGPKPMLMTGGSEGFVMTGLRGEPFVLVEIEVGDMSPWAPRDQYVADFTDAQGTVTPGMVHQGWTVELTFRES